MFLASGLGQRLRHALSRRGVNLFVTAAIVAGLASGTGGLLARATGSATVDAAMIASVLLLVPGVPALNAQSDILEGHPTLGSARIVSVIILLLFIATGVMISRILLGLHP